MESESAYSYSLTTFSPSGKLVQIEYALSAVQSGQTAIGIKATNGVVLATEKKLPTLLIDESTVQKMSALAPHAGCVYAGISPDSRVLITRGRKQAQKYHMTMKDPMPALQLVKGLASVMQEFTQQGGVRPFGVSLLVAAHDDVLGHQLYQVDPSGSYWAWKATAVGKNMANAKTFLEKRYSDDMELEDAIHTAILTLKERFEGQMTSTNIEISVVGADGKFRCLAPAEILDYLSQVE